MVKDDTLYQRLDVQSDASEEEINKAFKLLARKYHPDKHTNENKEEMTKKFQEILQAKEILLDEEKRKTYDQVGMDMLNNNGEQQPDIHEFFRQFQGQFNSFGGFNPFGQQHNTKEQGEDIKLKLDVPLDKLYKCEVVNVSYKYKCICVKCNGEGSKDGKSHSCNQCNGVGVVGRQIQIGPMLQIAQMQCPVCRGSGKQSVDKCDVCIGKTFTIKEKTISIPLKQGLTTGSEIPFPNKGHQLKNSRTNLIFIVNELPHHLFKRVNNDLILNVELKLYQALFGFDKVIEHLDGRKIHIHYDGKTEFNQVRKIVGQGMKSINTNSVGDLYIRFSTNIPNLFGLSPETKQEYKKLFMSFDKIEVQSEMQVIKDKLQLLPLTECKDKEKKMLNRILMEEQLRLENPSDEGNSHERQCAHQ
jgi:DnaJ-class molecular chaperone